MRISTLTVVLLACLCCVTAMAELQNVELGGSIRIRGNYYNMDSMGDYSFVEQRTRLNVKADFTDDVSAFIEFDYYDFWGEDFRSMYICGNDMRGIDVAVMIREETRHGEAIEFAGMTSQRAVDGIRLAGKAGIIDAGAATDPVSAGAAIKGGIDGGSDRGVADAHFANADEIRLAGDRLHAIGDGGGAHLVVQRRLQRDIAGGQFQRQFEDAQVDFVQRADLGNGGAAIGEIGNHLGGDFARKGGHTLIGHAVIAGKDGHHRIVEPGLGPALPTRQKLDQAFERAERTGRLGQLRVARTNRGNRGLIAIGRNGQQFEDVGISGAQRGHGESVWFGLGRRDLLPITGRKAIERR